MVTQHDCLFVHHFFVLQNIIENFRVRRGTVLDNFTWRDMDPNVFLSSTTAVKILKGATCDGLETPLRPVLLEREELVPVIMMLYC